MAIFSQNTRRTPLRYTAAPVQFHTRKYGPELLVDVAFVREMAAFILHGPHTLAFYDIILVTEGRGTFTLDGVRYRGRPGVLFFTTPGQIRTWHVRDFDGICLFFPALFLEEFFNDPLFLQRLPYFHAPGDGAATTLSPQRAAQLQRRLVAMQRELHRLRPDSVHLLRAQVYELLIALARAYAAVHGGDVERTPNLMVLRYREMIEQWVMSRRQVGTYAQELGISPGYLNTLCQRHAGRSAKALIADRLVLEARRLLLYTNESAARIAATLSFEDPSYFSRFFRAHTGRSPRQFQREHGHVPS